MEFSDIRDIILNGADCVVDVTRGDDETCRFISAKEKYFNVSSDGGVLTVSQKSGNIFYRLLMKKFEFKLVLPKSFSGKFKFRNKNGGLFINGGTFDSMDLYIKNGKFDLENISCAEFFLKMRNGSATLKNMTSTGDVAVKCSNGHVKTESLNARSLTISCNNADLSAIDVKTDKFDCSTHNGTIDTSAVDSSDIKIETSNGKINALCLGSRDNFRLLLETTHGAIHIDGAPSKNVSDPVGAKKRVSAKTSNGDIDLKFV